MNPIHSLVFLNFRTTDVAALQGVKKQVGCVCASHLIQNSATVCYEPQIGMPDTSNKPTAEFSDIRDSKSIMR